MTASQNASCVAPVGHCSLPVDASGEAALGLFDRLVPGSDGRVHIWADRVEALDAVTGAVLVSAAQAHTRVAGDEAVVLCPPSQPAAGRILFSVLTPSSDGWDLCRKHRATRFDNERVLMPAVAVWQSSHTEPIRKAITHFLFRKWGSEHGDVAALAAGTFLDNSFAHAAGTEHPPVVACTVDPSRGQACLAVVDRWSLASEAGTSVIGRIAAASGELEHLLAKTRAAGGDLLFAAGDRRLHLSAANGAVHSLGGHVPGVAAVVRVPLRGGGSPDRG